MQPCPWGKWKTEIINTINSIQVKDDPFYYFYIEPFLPEKLYEMLNLFWPSIDSFWGQNDIANEPLHHKEANLRKVVIIDDTPGFGKTPEAVEFWKNFQKLIRGSDLSKSFINKFEKYIRITRNDIDSANLPYYSNALLEDDSNGFKLGPHIDSQNNLISLLFYLPQKNCPENRGTCVYEPKKHFSQENPDIGKIFNGEYFSETDFELRFQAPYRSNSLFGLINEPRAYHGVKEITDDTFNRRHIQWTISKVNVDPYPSALDRVNIGITPEVQRIESRIKELLKSKLS